MGVALPLYRVCLPEVEPGVDDTPLGAISTKVDGAGPQPSDDAGSPCRDLVVRGINSSMLGHTTLGTHGPSPRVLGCRGSGGSQTASTGLPRFSVLACELGAGGEQHRAGMFAGQSHEKNVAGDVGHGRPGYPTRNSS
jgi:hypothetical protein